MEHTGYEPQASFDEMTVPPLPPCSVRMRGCEGDDEDVYDRRDTGDWT